MLTISESLNWLTREISIEHGKPQFESIFLIVLYNHNNSSNEYYKLYHIIIDYRTNIRYAASVNGPVGLLWKIHKVIMIAELLDI